MLEGVAWICARKYKEMKLFIGIVSMDLIPGMQYDESIGYAWLQVRCSDEIWEQWMKTWIQIKEWIRVTPSITFFVHRRTRCACQKLFRSLTKILSSLLLQDQGSPSMRLWKMAGFYFWMTLSRNVFAMTAEGGSLSRRDPSDTRPISLDLAARFVIWIFQRSRLNLHSKLDKKGPVGVSQDWDFANIDR